MALLTHTTSLLTALAPQLSSGDVLNAFVEPTLIAVNAPLAVGRARVGTSPGECGFR